MLIGCDDSSLVVDRLRDQARGKNTAVTSFYFDFTVQKELAATAILGSMLKQIINGMETFPKEIQRGIRERGHAYNKWKLELADIVQILQLITSSQPTFMCIDGLDECVGAHRAIVLHSLKQILEKSPYTRIFMTGRHHFRAEIEERLSGRVISAPVGPNRDDIITFLRARLAEDEKPDAMEESLEADILERIPEKISGM